MWSHLIACASANAPTDLNYLNLSWWSVGGPHHLISSLKYGTTGMLISRVSSLGYLADPHLCRTHRNASPKGSSGLPCGYHLPSKELTSANIVIFNLHWYPKTTFLTLYSVNVAAKLLCAQATAAEVSGRDRVGTAGSIILSVFKPTSATPRPF